MIRTSIVALLSLALSVAAIAADGKWTPQQVLQLDPEWLAKEGLEVDPATLWNEAEGTGLLAAAIKIGGCSGGFISPEGLIITNHHCVFSVLQEHATPGNDIISNGFLARDRAGELPTTSVRVTVPRRFTDVTPRMEGAIPAAADDAARRKAIEERRKELVAECEKTPGAKCTVAAHDGGVQYVLIETFELPDVRLVYAPPRSVGEFGGEVDNWMWPRHTGDFAIVRVYATPEGASAPHSAQNVPYRPRFHFPIATEGVGPGDFVMGLGYPGTTYRALTADEMSERAELFFPRRAELYREWIGLLEAAGEESDAARIAVANDLKTLLNRAKNAEGQIAGLRRGRILESQRAADEAVLGFARNDSAHAGALPAHDELRRLNQERLQGWEREFLLDQLGVGPKSIRWAQLVGRSARQRALDEGERETNYQERNLPRIVERTERDQKSYLEPADKAMLASWVQRALSLPAGSRIEAVDRAFAKATTPAAIRTRIDELYRRSRIDDLAARKAMLAETESQLSRRRDPLVDLGLALDSEMRAVEVQTDRRAGAIARLRPIWRRAVIAHAGRPVAPDANSTLRATFGHVMGYSPRDGVWYTPFTTLEGMVAKHTGEEPFDAPDRVLEAAGKRTFGSWTAAGLDQVPVNFLADLDTTGGNSGSPVLNGRGELVGVNFDRVWENVANDFGFNPAIARNVTADVRYLLWMLDQIEDADVLLRELGVR